jgi:hypothetical protein
MTDNKALLATALQQSENLLPAEFYGKATSLLFEMLQFAPCGGCVHVLNDSRIHFT